MNTEIAERIAKGNKAYYANAKLIKWIEKLLKEQKMQQSILCQCKTNKIDICTEKHQNENI